MFGPYFHQTGYVVATTGRAPAKAVEHLEKALLSVQADPTFAPGIKRLSGAADFKDYTWQYSGPLSGFKGYFNRLAGYAHSADALKGLWEHCASRGVRFILGEEAGKVEKLVYQGRKCTGIATADGRTHEADLVICALGAHGASLLPHLGKFVVGRCWSVAHVQLSEEECNFLRGIPTTNVRDLGFFFEAHMLPPTAYGWAIVFGLAFISHASGQVAIAFALAYLPAAFSSLTLLLQPVVAAILAWVLLNEAIGPMQAIGGLVVLAGIMIARRG